MSTLEQLGNNQSFEHSQQQGLRGEIKNQNLEFQTSSGAAGVNDHGALSMNASGNYDHQMYQSSLETGDPPSSQAGYASGDSTYANQGMGTQGSDGQSLGKLVGAFGQDVAQLDSSLNNLENVISGTSSTTAIDGTPTTSSTTATDGTPTTSSTTAIDGTPTTSSTTAIDGTPTTPTAATDGTPTTPTAATDGTSGSSPETVTQFLGQLVQDLQSGNLNQAIQDTMNFIDSGAGGTASDSTGSSTGAGGTDSTGAGNGATGASGEGGTTSGSPESGTAGGSGSSGSPDSSGGSDDSDGSDDSGDTGSSAGTSAPSSGDSTGTTADDSTGSSGDGSSSESLTQYLAELMQDLKTGNMQQALTDTEKFITGGAGTSASGSDSTTGSTSGTGASGALGSAATTAGNVTSDIASIGTSALSGNPAGVLGGVAKLASDVTQPVTSVISSIGKSISSIL